jgi:cytochrome c oxidase assembly protein subunit 15
MSTFRKLSIASLCATFVLVAIGGLVNATKSGLGCGDDWPDCNGRLAPALETRAEIIEFSHRAAAGIVIVLLGLLMIVAIKNHRSERYILWPAIGAFFFVIGQALLGAAVVFLDLRASTVTAHLALALSLLAVLIYLVAASSAREASGPRPFRDRSLMRQTAGAALATLLLLLVGSYVSGRGAGLAFPDWPLMDGQVIPDLGHEAQGIHFLHRALAAVVGGIVLLTGLRLIKLKAEAPLVARLAHIAMGLFAVEILIGAVNVWTDLNSIAVTAHLAIGALIWGSLVAATVSLHPALDRLGEPVRPRHTKAAALEGGR